jgi:transcriptional regulator with XRE-family HTH domain
MKIERQTTPEAIMTELGMRIAHRRIELGMTQAEAADRAGVAKRTLERIEAGDDTQLTTFIRLLRVLDSTDSLDQLVPEVTVTPMEILRHQPRLRKRASSKRLSKPDKPWKWGDEQ